MSIVNKLKHINVNNFFTKKCPLCPVGEKWNRLSGYYIEIDGKQVEICITHSMEFLLKKISSNRQPKKENLNERLEKILDRKCNQIESATR